MRITNIPRLQAESDLEEIVLARKAQARASLGNLLRTLYDGRKAIACRYGQEEYADRERSALPPLDVPLSDV